MRREGEEEEAPYPQSTLAGDVLLASHLSKAVPDPFTPDRAAATITFDIFFSFARFLATFRHLFSANQGDLQTACGTHRVAHHSGYPSSLFPSNGEPLRRRKQPQQTCRRRRREKPSSLSTFSGRPTLPLDKVGCPMAFPHREEKFQVERHRRRPSPSVTSANEVPAITAIF